MHARARALLRLRARARVRAAGTILPLSRARVRALSYGPPLSISPLARRFIFQDACKVYAYQAWDKYTGAHDGIQHVVAANEVVGADGKFSGANPLAHGHAHGGDSHGHSHAGHSHAGH